MKNLIKPLALGGTVFLAPISAFALDITAIVAEMATAVTDVTAVFAAMAGVIGLMFVISRVRQLAKS